MILLPAVDILDSHAVRLAQGDYRQSTVYSEDPVRAALQWAEAGARALHVVDLDGARSGSPVNLPIVQRITAAVGVPVQLGGGLRSAESVRQALSAGAARVVLGTAALTDVDFVDEVLAAHGDRVIVSVDARAGRVASEGWTEQSEVPALAALEALGRRGVRRFVYSSIDRDGTLEGPDLEEVCSVAATVRGTFVYSGGVSSLEDLRALRGLRQVNLSGVIVGKALYEGRFTVREAMAALAA